MAAAAAARDMVSDSRSGLLHLRHQAVPPAWTIGLALAVVGYATCGFGLNLIKLSHIKHGGSSSPALQPTRWNRRGTVVQANAMWACGLAANAVGGSLNLCGLRFAAQSMLAPLSSVALVANLLCATALLGERFSPVADAAPLLLIAAGNVATVTSASHRAQDALTLPQLAELFRRPPFRAWLLVVAVCSASLMAVRARLRAQIRRDGGEEFASPTLLARAGLCHTAAAAMLSVQTVLLGKASVLVLADGVANVFKLQFLLLASAWLALAAFWVYTLNRLLRSHDAMCIVPIIEVCWSLLSLLSGGIFFSEYSDMSRRQIAGFLTGVVLNVVGVWRLTQRGEKSGKIG